MFLEVPKVTRLIGFAWSYPSFSPRSLWLLLGCIMSSELFGVVYFFANSLRVYLVSSVRSGDSPISERLA